MDATSGAPDAAADGGAQDASSSTAAADAGATADLRDALPPDTMAWTPLAPWTGTDIGDIGAQKGGAGVVTAANNMQTLHLSGGGVTGIGGKVDSLYFVHQSVAGDGSVLGRVNTLMMVDASSAAGFMVRESLDADAAMIFVGAFGDGSGGKVVFRKARGQEAMSSPAEGAMPPNNPNLKQSNFIRVTREGSLFRVYAGARESVEKNESMVGMVDLALAYPAKPLYFGAAITAKHPTLAARARIEDFSIDNLPSRKETAAWRHEAIGTSASAAVWNGDELTMSSLGQPWGAVTGTSRDFMSFAYVNPQGGVSLRFLVAAESMADAGGRVAVMLRDVSTFSRSGAFVAMSLTQGVGLEIEQRSMSMGELEKVASKAKVAAPLWLRLDRAMAPIPNDPLGGFESKVTAYYAEDGGGTPKAWTAVGNPLTLSGLSGKDLGLGIAVAAFADTAYTTARIKRLSLEELPAVGMDADAGAGPPADAGSPLVAPGDASAGQ
jgi:hypothetical protein